MALWGKTDNAANSPGHATALVNLPANSANKTALFGNTTQGAFKNNNVAMKKAVGVFGMDATEAQVANGAIIKFIITNPGSGYNANAAVTVSGNATANATATAGKISAVNVNTAGSGYLSKPSTTIASPAAQAFNANTAVDETEDFIAISSNPFVNNDLVTYTVSAGNTALLGLTSGSKYYTVEANSSGTKLSSSKDGDAIELTKGLTQTGHSLTGETATAEAVISGVKGKGVHTGWNLRTEGQGGRAGRVTYETLVAMREISGDASDDTILKDS